ncbi:MAG: hypothetical protein H0U49_08665 [Parachlamydiaceae bacterium]|nr:hypothetical protein [Parachlamydiaceae bacterium]
MIAKSAFLNTCKEFAYKIRNCRNSAIHLGDNLVLGETVMGSPIIIDSRHYNSLKLLYLPPPKEIAVMSYLFHYIKPTMRCLDIGAGTGYYSMVLAKLVGPKGQVFSFEDDEGCYRLLKRNVKLNAFTSICGVKRPTGIDQYLDSHKNSINFVHISSESNLANIYRDMQITVRLNPSIQILCHINPELLLKMPSLYEPFFQAVISDGFEGYLFPSLNSLDSKEQLTEDPSVKFLLLCKGSLWTEIQDADG